MEPLESTSRLQELLAGGQDAQAELAGRLAAHPDPMVRVLGELWVRRDGERAEDQPPPAPPPPAIEELDLEVLGLPDDPDAPVLRRRLERLELELERLQEINDLVAGALGACDLCWGDDPACEDCGGRGGPGGRRPDLELFERLVAPAVRRLRKTRTPSVGLGGRPPAHRLPIDDRATTERREE